MFFLFNNTFKILRNWEIGSYTRNFHEMTGKTNRPRSTPARQNDFTR